MQEFTKYTIRTEGGQYREEAIRIASGWFNAFNVIEGTGYWKGQREEALLIEVIDTGTGIAPEELARIFRVYYSTKKSGSGLGLPTTRRIVHEHGGALNVESDVGKGTRFTIALPLIED